MDTDAESTERDRSATSSANEEKADRSRSVCLSGWPRRLPGGWFTVTALVFLVLLTLTGRYVLQPFEIPSGSMRPGLNTGDRVLVNRVAYLFGATPQRGDVVVFDGTGYFGDADYIKRVVGVGGDHVVCCDSRGRLRVNGEPVRESAYLYPGDAPSQAAFDVLVPDGTLFLLGDHRSASSDSRDHLGGPGGGMVPVGAVIGKARWIAWPMGHWDTVGFADMTGAVAGASAAGGGAVLDGGLADEVGTGGRPIPADGVNMAGLVPDGLHG